jgi:hypothetical protein
MPIGAVAADFDRDRVPDLVTANVLSGDVSLLVNQLQNPIPCAGDCDERGDVEIDELVRGVNVALGRLMLIDCAAADADGNGAVEVDELIQAVQNVLAGCGD